MKHIFPELNQALVYFTSTLQDVPFNMQALRVFHQQADFKKFSSNALLSSCSLQHMWHGADSNTGPPLHQTASAGTSSCPQPTLLKALQHLSISRCRLLRELPHSLGINLGTALQQLHVDGCGMLKELPGGIANLVCLKVGAVHGHVSGGWQSQFTGCASCNRVGLTLFVQQGRGCIALRLGVKQWLGELCWDVSACHCYYCTARAGPLC